MWEHRSQKLTFPQPHRAALKANQSGAISARSAQRRSRSPGPDPRHSHGVEGVGRQRALLARLGVQQQVVLAVVPPGAGRRGAAVPRAVGLRLAHGVPRLCPGPRAPGGSLSARGHGRLRLAALPAPQHRSSRHRVPRRRAGGAEGPQSPARGYYVNRCPRSRRPPLRRRRGGRKVCSASGGPRGGGGRWGGAGAGRLLRGKREKKGEKERKGERKEREKEGKGEREEREKERKGERKGKRKEKEEKGKGRKRGVLLLHATCLYPLSVVSFWCSDFPNGNCNS